LRLKCVLLLQQHEQDIHEASTSPTPSPVPDPEAAPEDSTQDRQQQPEGSVTLLATTQPAAVALQPDQVLIAHDSTQEHCSASSEQEAQANTDQADVAAANQHSVDNEQLPQAEAEANQAGDSQGLEQAQDAVSQTADTSEPQPDSNGTTLAPAADKTEQQHASASEADDHAESSPAQSEPDDAAQQVAEPTQQHEDQQEQLPVSSLYMADQVDQSSQRSLPDSAKSAADSRQQPASPSGQDEAASHSGTEAQHVNGITHEMQQEELEQQIGSQQSSQDSHEQQAAIPGTCMISLETLWTSFEHTAWTRCACLDTILQTHWKTQANVVNCHLSQGMRVWQCVVLLSMDTAQHSGSGQCHSTLPTIRGDQLANRVWMLQTL